MQVRRCSSRSPRRSAPDCAFVLVAGGLGERLGYHGIKVALPTTLASKVCYLQMYIEQILALQAASNARAGNSDAAGTTRRIPLAIMTSDDTHAATVALLEANNYFGMQKGQVTLMKQEKVPALVDNHATIAMDGKYSVVTKPHGHGDVHTLLAGHGIAKQWAAEGRKYVTFFQDTNAACFDFLPRSLGVAVSQKYEVLSMCIPRKAGEAVGAITRLRRSDGSSITTCVEYNQLAPLLIATTNPDGDVNDPATGFSPFPGNLNQLIFAIQPYAAVLERTGGLVPEFVNPKYADEARSRFTKPTRLECMMQDHPKVLGPDARVGFVSLPVQSFSPVKNSIEGGQGKAKAGLRPQCALSGEMDVYGLAGERLAELGVRIEAPKPFTACGITVDRPAGVVLNARIGASHAALSAAFPTPSAVSVTQRSFLVIRGGGDVTIHSLTLDGTLVVEVAEGEHAHIRDLTVTNAGWDFQALAEDEAGVDDSLRIRGYRLVMAEDRRIVFDAEGRHDHTVTHHPREVLSGKAAVPAADSS